MINPIAITAYTTTNALGKGVNATFNGLTTMQSGLVPNNYPHARLNTYIGRVHGIEESPVSQPLKHYDCRNNRLAEVGLKQDNFIDAVMHAKEKYGAHRLAVIIGTSTSGIEQTELAYRQRDAAGNLPKNYFYKTTQNVHAITDFVAQFFKVYGPCYTVSTACSSSAKVFAVASRLLEAKLIDAAIVGGVDSLCASTLYGFNALELLSNEKCQPFDVDRNGLTIGEAAGFALLERKNDHAQIFLMGSGESSDAYHMSSPHPEGIGARLAMEEALCKSSLSPEKIDYINLHGTATKMNDATENIAIEAVFGPNKLSSSTKGATGHTLGAAGIVEAIICFLCLEKQFLPANFNLLKKDPLISLNLLTTSINHRVQYVLSNSFGFGGNNCSLIFGKL